MKAPLLPCVLLCWLLLFLSFSAVAQVNVLTYHDDNRRTGMNTNETILTPANVNSNTFGKLFSYSLDGQAYAQPLYVSRLAVSGKGTHNVLFVATEHNSLYAFDADTNGAGGGLLWSNTLGTSASSETTNFGSTGIGDYNNIAPEVGITSTPVIDPIGGTIYVDAFTHDNTNSNTNYVHRIHAYNIATGAERPYSPVVVAATYPGVGIGSVGGVQSFLALREIQRASLTLSGGIVYLQFAGYADINPYHGWVIGYNATNLAPLNNYVFNSTPNSSVGQGGFWGAGCGASVDTAGNLLCVTGNGAFTATNGSGGTEYGDTVLSLSTSNGLAVADYFTPYNQSNLLSSDQDLGSGGILVLPDQPGPYPHLMVTGGKSGVLYLINRDQFTLNNNHYDATNTVDYNVQSITLSSMILDTPTYLNGEIYIANTGSALKAFSLSNGALSSSPVSTSTRTYAYPGATPIVTANGASNGIVWALANTSPAVLVAYNATNLAAEIYSTSQAAGNRDQLFSGIKFTSPIVANGRVYAAGQSQVTVLGLLNSTVYSQPTGIMLSNASVLEGQAPGASVGSFSTAEPDGADTFTYTLVSGTGSTGNSSFSISSNTLLTAATFDYATQNSYSIRVRSTGQSSQFAEQAFTITVLSTNTPPVPAAIANQTINAGVTLVITNSASDAQSPPQVLTFSLLESPTNATISPLDSTDAVFTWRPLVSQANTTNLVSIQVTDNGTPNLSATNNFTVTVNPLTPISFSSVNLAGSTVSLTVNGPEGPDYTLLTSTNLTTWQVVTVTNSPTTPVTLMATKTSDAERFYRIEIGP